MGIKTKIDWCDASWNPVTGCLHGCQYCYAKRIAERFGLKYAPKLGDPGMEGACKYDTEELGQDTMLELEKPYVDRDGVKSPYPMAFLPTFHKYRLGIPQSWKQPKTIFVCSMADLFGEWVPEEWIKAVFDACDKAPQHRYLFLTKNPKRYTRMANAHLVKEWNEEHPEEPMDTNDFEGITPLPVRDNWWFGSTIDSTKATRFHGDFTWNTFTSIEPITEFLDMGLGSFGSDKWTIIGAETGNRKGKIIPERRWIDNVVKAAGITRMKVFMKESLREMMGADFRQEFPWD